MKKLYFLMIALLAVTVSSFAQTTYYWQPTNGGNWTTANNWRTNANGTGGSRNTPANSDILIIDRLSSQTITNVPTQTIGNLRVLSGTVTLQGGGANVLTINNGTGADLRVAGDATLIFSSLSAILGTNASAEIAGTVVFNNTFNLQNNGVVTTVTPTGTLSVAGNNGIVTNSSTNKLVVNGTYSHERNGGTIPDAAWNTGSKFVLSISGATAPSNLNQTFHHIEISGNVGQNVNLNSSLTAAGDFVFATTGGSGVRIANNGTSRTVSVGGNFIHNSGILSAVDDDGNVTMNIAGNYEINGGTFFLKNGAGNGTMNVTGNMSIKGGEFFVRANNGGAVPGVNVSGLFSITAGTLNMSSTSGQGSLVLRGGFYQNGGTITETSNSNGSITFDGATVQTFEKVSGTIANSINVSISNNAKVDFGTSVLDNTGGSFTLNSNARIITAHAEGLRSTGNAGTIRSNTRSYNGGAHYEFRGATTGNFTLAGGANTTFSGSVTINNASGVAASRAFTISGSLILENGYLTAGNNNIELTTSGTVTSNNGAFVYASATGTMRKQIGSTNTAFEFPVGAPSVGLRPVRIQSANTGSGTSTFSAYYVRGNASTVGATLGSGVARVSPCEYWNVTRPSGTRSASVRIGWVPASNCANGDYVTNLSALLAARYTGAQWVNAGGSVDLPASTTTAGTITIPSSSNFGFFALASSNITDNPLPVLFDGVKAYSKNGGVQLEWSNLTERDVIRYEVERSANGIDFYPVNQQAPKSNRDDKASYDFFDAAPIDGANFYRIRVDEIGGKPVYSKILRVEMGSTKVGFSMYPNPVVGRQLTVSLSGLRQGQYSLDVYNTAGQRVYSTRINNVGAGITQMIELPASIKTGAYVTVITGDSYRESKQFIVK